MAPQGYKNHVGRITQLVGIIIRKAHSSQGFLEYNFILEYVFYIIYK